MRTILVIPTYNERMNILTLVQRTMALSVVPDLFFIDDHSPDGTGKLLNALRTTHQSLRVLHRPQKLGLGSAYRQAFRLLLSEPYDRYLTMDADLSHRPESIPALLQASAEADLVIGSRYTDGGACANWSSTRHLLSRTANSLTRRLLRLPIRDITAGFRCYRRELVEALDRIDVRSTGYSFQIEMAYYAQRLGFCVREEPIIFEKRAYAKSKMSWSEIAQAVQTLFRLWLQHRSGQSIREKPIHFPDKSAKIL